jgi:hypothetical protein
LPEQLSPGAAQMPQLRLQHTSPSLQVFRPHGMLTGKCKALSQLCGSQLSPGAVQMPQLGLQQTCPVLHVLRPHGMLTG